MSAKQVVLASASEVRARLLKSAGVDCAIVPSGVDEGPIKAAALADGLDAETLADRLAAAKALAVAKQQPGALVIGADQILDCDGELFDKPVDRAAAGAALAKLAGREHRLVTACCLSEGGEVVWRHVDAPRLTIRPMDAAAIEAYLDEAGDDVLSSVGAYRLEGVGVRLFSHVDGDFFTILGLPLVALLAALRKHGGLEDAL